MKALQPRILSKRRKIILITSIVLVALVGTGAYIYFANKQNEVNNNIQNEAGTVKKEQVKTTDSTSPSNLPSKSPGGSGQSDPNGQSTETPSTPPEKPTIERAGGNPTIKVVATFQKASTGYCELQLSKDGQQTLSYNSTILVSASYYTCSFSISRTSLPADYPWSATVIHHIGTASTKSDTKDLE